MKLAVRMGIVIIFTVFLSSCGRSILWVSSLLQTHEPGELDTNFGDNGVWTVNLEGDNLEYTPNSLAIQADGNIVVVGRVENKPGVLQLLPTGVLDPDFADQGMFVFNEISINGYAQSLTIDDQGRIIALAILASTSNSNMVIRLLPDGSLDTDMQGVGYALLPYTNSIESVNDIVVRNEGYFIGGHGRDAATDDVDAMIIGLDENGNYDASWGNNGHAYFDAYDGDEFCRGPIRDNNNDWLLFGTAYHNAEFDAFIAKFNNSNTLESSFGTNGVFTHDVFDDDFCRDVHLLSDNSFLCAGHAEHENNSDIFISKHRENGSLDTSFGDNGVFILDLSDDDRLCAVDVHDDGRILAVGSASNGNNQDALLLQIPSDYSSMSDTSYTVTMYDVVSGNNDEALNMAFDAEQNLIVLGKTIEDNESDMFVLRIFLQ